jgi:hypothetical protein
MSQFSRVLAGLLVAIPAFAQLTITASGAASLSVSPAGSWSISVPGLKWTFSGTIGAPAVAAHVNEGKDTAGAWQEIAFDYQLSGVSRSASIRLYQNRPAALFSSTLNAADANTTSFPVISAYPTGLSHVSFNGLFAPPQFTHLIAESPWAYFDAAGNTFILSPASNFMTSVLDRRADGSLATGISPKIANLPAGFQQSALLVFGKGINQTFDNWGLTLTGLSGKKRPANDADALLKSISYWTDNGATYYYNAGGASYSGTLEAIRKEFDDKGVRLGSLQLDSWWYPKGPDNSWSSHSGIWTYKASTALFLPDLSGFQKRVKTPLITHARWIDANSPYRTQYAMSGNVIVDPRYWDDTAAYLKASGVATYEQDWLGTEAHSDFNLTDPDLFLTGMASAMAKQGLTVQYCMATPQHFLQSTKYSNVTTIRASQDRFRPENWTEFFYSSRLASALGVLPFTDVFMSSETNNLIPALLSAGPVAFGDPMGTLSRENLLLAARSDGVIVKPDVPATPLDSVFRNDAKGTDVPMVAATHTDFGSGLKTHYIFAYPRGANKTITINPVSYGIAGDAWLYDALHRTGRLIISHSTYTLDLNEGPAYFVLAPVGPSGIAVLGDRNHLVSMGKKRISAYGDTGTANLSVVFAAGESARTIFGYSASPVLASAITGSAGGLTWDPSTQIFTLNVYPVAGKASLSITVAGTSIRPPHCLKRCVAGAQ